MSKSYEAKVGERVCVRAFSREHLAPPFVDLRIGKWGELELTMALEPDEARQIGNALHRSADAAEGREVKP